MAEVGLDGLLVSAPVEDTFKSVGANRRYLSGFTGSVGTLLITAEAAFIAVDFRYYEQAQQRGAELHAVPRQRAPERPGSPRWWARRAWRARSWASRRAISPWPPTRP